MSSRASRANGRLGEWATRRRGDTATRWRGNTRGVRTTLFGRLFQGESLLEPNPGLKPWAILLCHFVAFAVSPYRRIAVSPYRRIAVSPYRRIAVSPYRRIAASPHRRIAASPFRTTLPTLCPRTLAALMQNHGHNFAGGIAFEIELGIDNLVEKFVFSAGVNRGSWLAGELGFKMVAF